jgi:hypothetical protein
MKCPSFLGKDDIAVGYEISGALRLDWDRTLSTRNTMMRLQAEGRAATVWLGATVCDEVGDPTAGFLRSGAIRGGG